MTESTMDPTFYRTAADAAAAAPEDLAYVVAFDRAGVKHDAMTVVDLKPGSDTYGQVVGWTDVPGVGDDRFLYVACWGIGEMKQYDVTDPAHPVQVGSVRLGGIVNRTPHPAKPDMPLSGAPQMVEVSRDGRRVYFTNSLYGAWDDHFYPDGVGAWMVKLDADPNGGLSIDESFFPHGDDFRGLRVHQIRLQGGDASSDSYCFR